MSREAERRASELADEYLVELRNGKTPSQEWFLSRCPVGERDSLLLAMEGIDFMIATERSANTGSTAFKLAYQKAMELRRRRDIVANAMATGSGQKRADQSRPEEYICEVLGLSPTLASQPDHSDPGRSSIGLWHRGASKGSTARNDEMLLQLIERRMAAEAEALLSAALIEECPVDLGRIVDYLSLFVKEQPLDDGIDGCLITYGELGGIILNSNVMNSRRRRFTLAHELAHYVLHRKTTARFRDSMAEMGSSRDTETELQADTFACMLLMPSSLLSEQFGMAQPSLVDGEELANQFEVSFAAALRRMVRASHWACALIVSKGGTVNWSVCSPLLDTFIYRTVDHTTAAAELHAVEQNGEEHARRLSAQAWFANPSLSETDVIEQSRYVGNGYVYSIVTVVEDR